MNPRETLTTATVIAVAAVALACTTPGATRAAGSENASPDASPSGDAVDKARAGAEKAGEKIKEGARETGRAVDATMQHLDVKAALLADKTVDASHIDIDTDKDAKILYLRGTVPTAAQKKAAERIARDKADGFTVRNELTVMSVPKK